jgi:hypothetical protein
MFSIIPDWAIGVGFSLIALFIGVGIMYRLMPADVRTSGRKRHAAVRVGDTTDPGASQPPELDDVHRRLNELEERLDFAERLLTQQRETDRLSSPQR